MEGSGWTGDLDELRAPDVVADRTDAAGGS
jgi:hypothetical protein